MNIYEIIISILTVLITGLGIAITKLSGNKKKLAQILKIFAMNSADIVNDLHAISESDKKAKKVLSKEKIIK